MSDPNRREILGSGSARLWACARIMSLSGLLLAVAGCTRSASEPRAETDSPAPNAKSEPESPAPPTTDWQTYQSAKYGYSVLVPGAPEIVKGTLAAPTRKAPSKWVVSGSYFTPRHIVGELTAAQPEAACELMMPPGKYRIVLKSSDPMSLVPYLRVYRAATTAKSSNSINSTNSTGTILMEDVNPGGKAIATVVLRQEHTSLRWIVATSFRQRGRGRFSLDVIQLSDAKDGDAPVEDPEWRSDGTFARGAGMFVAIVDHEWKRPSADASDVLDQLRDDLSGIYILESESKVTLSGHPGRELRLSPDPSLAPPSPGKMPTPVRARIYLVGQHVHQLSVSGEKTVINGAEGDKIFESFRLKE
jgi:hypothetical protein